MHLGQQIERLTDAYLRAIIPLDEYERRRRDLDQRVQALAGQDKLLRHDAARQQHLAGVAASLEVFRTCVQHGLAAATFEQRRQLVFLLIDRVVVTDADVEIRYVLPTSTESENVRFCQLRKDYFDHPSAWGVGVSRRRGALLAAAADVGGEAIIVGDLAWPVIVVAFVQAQVLRFVGGGLGAGRLDGVKGVFQQLEVDHVGASDSDSDREGEGEGEATAIGQQRPLGASLATVGRVGAGFFSPPSGALVIAPSTASHSQSMPTRPS